LQLQHAEQRGNRIGAVRFWVGKGGDWRREELRREGRGEERTEGKQRLVTPGIIPSCSSLISAPEFHWVIIYGLCQP
jgi:hypothetical protein